MAGYLLIFLLVTATNAYAVVNIEDFGNDAVTLLQEYIRTDTVNPPGNESNSVQFLAKILSAEKIPYESVESEPGRGNIWAKLEGGNKPALILLHHMDVVPADENYWDVPPFQGLIKDNYVYGRGALDMKSLGIVHLQTFLALHKEGKPLNRDVIFVATADEEAGGLYGAGWLVKNKPELFKNAGMLLNEGGSGTYYGNRKAFSIEVAQKKPLWLRLTATDKPGHGSSPRISSSTTRLIAALYKIQNFHFPPRIVPSVDTYFKGLAELQDKGWKDAYTNMTKAVEDPDFSRQLQLHNAGHHALIRNTCSITRLSGSNKINVVPPTSTAEIDCRLLPDQDPEEFIKELQLLINDPKIKIDKILSFSAPTSTPDTLLYNAIVTNVKNHYPGSAVLPSVSTGFTDSHFFRDLGIDCYGFDPFLITKDDHSTMHGNNERISVDNLKHGVEILFEILQDVVYDN